MKRRLLEGDLALMRSLSRDLSVSQRVRAWAQWHCVVITSALARCP